MSGIDAVLYEYVKFIHVIYGSFSVFRLQPLYAFLSTYAYSWIKLRRVEHCLIRFGIRWGLGGGCNQGWPWQPLGKFLNEVGWLTGAVAEQLKQFIRKRPAAPSEGDHRCGRKAVHRQPDECPANPGSSVTRSRSTAERIWTAWVGRRQRGGG